MRIRSILTVAALCAALLGVAQGQQAAATPSAKGPNGLGFAFDAPSGQLTASGFSLNLTPNTSGPTNITGIIDVTINIKVVSKFPVGTTFPCAAIAIGGQVNLNTMVVDGGIETANGTATGTSAAATSVTCSLTIPYEWMVSGSSTGDNGLLIAFAVGAVHPSGKTLRSSIQLSGIESLPTSGTTSRFAFHAEL
jgi:hypothetical protein